MRTTIVNLVRGALIGAAEVVPGVSGGTIALIVGIYRTLIDAAANAVLAVRQLVGLAGGPPSGRRFGGTLRALPWSLLIPVGIGMVVALILGARLLEPLIEEHPVQMRAIFFGLVLAGIYVPAHMVTRTRGGQWRPRDIILALVAAGIVFLLTGLPPGTVNDPSALVIIGSAAIAICALVLPGVSGSFLLLSFGMYEPTIEAVNDRNFGYLGLFMLGAILGLAVFVSILRWLLAHRARITLVILTGFMVGSLRALWPWQSDDRMLSGPQSDVFAVILLALLGAGIVVALLAIERRFGLSEEQADAEMLER
jgi:putative membrane protein